MTPLHGRLAAAGVVLAAVACVKPVDADGEGGCARGSYAVGDDCVDEDAVFAAVCAQRLACGYTPSRAACLATPPRLELFVATRDPRCPALRDAVVAVLACEAAVACADMPTPGARLPACEDEWRAVDAVGPRAELEDLCFQPNGTGVVDYCLEDGWCRDEPCQWNVCQPATCGVDGICEEDERCSLSGCCDDIDEQKVCVDGFTCERNAFGDDTGYGTCVLLCDDAATCPADRVCRDGGCSRYDVPCEDGRCLVGDVCIGESCRTPCADGGTCADGEQCRAATEQDTAGGPDVGDAGVEACFPAP